MATIHCPSCGEEGSLDQKYCRKCGFNLKPVTKLVAGDDVADVRREKAERDRAILQRMYRWLMWGSLIFFIGLVLLVSGRAFDLPKFFGPLSSFVMISGIAAGGYGILAALRDGVATSKKLPPATKAAKLADSSTNPLANGAFPISLPSVTERTTQFIGEDTQKP